MAREELYRAFGPKLIEALAIVVKNEINILRAIEGFPARTSAQLVTAMETELAQIPDFPWQD